MIKVRVIAPMGATVRGPAKLRLSEAQHAPRATQLRAARGKGVYDLVGAVSFKMGEEFAIDEFDGKLNSALFENLSGGADSKSKEEADAAEKAAADAKAKEEADAANQAE